MSAFDPKQTLGAAGCLALYPATMSRARIKIRVLGGGGFPAIQRSTSATGEPNFSARGDTPPDTCAANSIMRMTGVDTPQCAPAASVLNPYSYLFLPLFLLVVSGCPLLADTGPNANRSSPPRLLFIEGAYTASDP